MMPMMDAIAALEVPVQQNCSPGPRAAAHRTYCLAASDLPPVRTLSVERGARQQDDAHWQVTCGIAHNHVSVDAFVATAAPRPLQSSLSPARRGASRRVDVLW